MLNEKEFLKHLASNGGDNQKLRNNSLLSKDAWKAQDTAFLQANRKRLVGVADLMSRNLTHNLGGNGFAITVFEYEELTNPSGAELSMSGRVKGNNDEDEYTLKSMPMPIISKFWEIDARTLASSKQAGRPLDTNKAAGAGKCIAEKKEDMLFNGSSSFTYGGGVLYGYLDHPDRETVALGGAWTGLAMDVLLAKVIEMKQASLDNKKYGPWMLYLPSGYEAMLDKDYNTTRGITLRERILKIGGIVDIKIADVLPAANVVLVDLNVETVRMVIGQAPVILSWDIEGGCATDFYGYEIAVPQIRSDGEGNCGVIHAS